MAAITFFAGGLAYMGLELVWRGRTHYSMGLAGGLSCMLLAGLFTRFCLPVWAAYIISAALISAVEFIFGFIFNIRLKRNVWDYSKKAFSLYDQVCLAYSGLWGFLGVAIWGAIRLAGI